MPCCKLWVTATLMVLATVVQAAERPNIVLIMADDMGYSDIGCFGSEINTPNIDKLASEGLRFTQFYNTSRCCPTRASLLTGLYPHQAGMGGMVNGKGDINPKGPYQGYLNDHCVTIAEVLKGAGYGTYMAGKWHVGEERPHWPVDRGFDRYYGLLSGAMNYYDMEKGKSDDTTRRFAIDGEAYTPPKEDWYLTDAISDRSVEYIEAASAKEQPFFLYVAYTAPHWPLHAPEEVVQRYLGKYMDGWDALREERFARMVKMGLLDPAWKLSLRDDGAADWDSVKDKALMDRKMAVYAAQIDVMDQGIGRILAALDAGGRSDNTLVMFLSDNGGCHEGGALGFDRRNNGVPPGQVDSYMSYGQSWANASNTPFRMFKHWVHEGGISTPLVARWPAGIKEGGALRHGPAHVVDIMATCVALSGATYPTRVNDEPILPQQGKSLDRLFRDTERAEYGPIFWEHMDNRAVRDGDWKLVARKGGSWELYNLREDRTELRDRATEYPERVGRMTESFQEWAATIGVK